MFMEDEDKTRIKLRKTQKEYFEDDDEIKNETTLDKEYFEKDVKTDISETIQRYTTRRC